MKEVVALAAPYVFILGMLIGVGVLVHKTLVESSCPNQTCRGAQSAAQWRQWRSFDPDPFWPPFFIFLGASATAVFLSWRFDVNEFSMHHFYKNRLVRCYLGASRDGAERRPNQFTGFDPCDDIKLKEFRADSGYAGPYPILNTALNLTKGKELGWQERKAESFVYTPRFVGYEVEQERAPTDPAVKRAGYRPTEEFAYRDGPGIGTAASISGAAANPNMGYHSSPVTAFLLTLFNARLGWWVGNTRHRQAWREQSPILGLAYLTKELTGSTDNRSSYINISDGGHFDNLGIYELVRRRCRYVVAVDGEQDFAVSFGGLANAIRKCRTDFGVDIRIDLSDIRHAVGARSRAHCAIGRIHYPETGSKPGYLLLLKSTLTGEESPDVLEYEKRQPTFPHQSTGDQWFDESQFESYRALGFRVTTDALKLAVGNKWMAGEPRSLETLFDYLRYLWTPMPAQGAELLTKHAAAYSELFERVRREPDLAGLDPLMYAKLSEDPTIADRNELYFGHAIIDLMHRVFVDLSLDVHYSRPHNVGWLRIFHQWTRLDQVKNAWTKVADTYSPRFKAFFERMMRQKQSP